MMSCQQDGPKSASRTKRRVVPTQLALGVYLIGGGSHNSAPAPAINVKKLMLKILFRNDGCALR